MKKTIWYMHRPGDTRDYAMTELPAPEWAAKQHEEGFELYEIEVDVPTLTPTTGTLRARAQRKPLAVQEDRTLEQQQKDGDAPA